MIDIEVDIEWSLLNLLINAKWLRICKFKEKHHFPDYKVKKHIKWMDLRDLDSRV